MEDEEGEDSNFVSCIIIVIIVFLLLFIFRNQITSCFTWLFNSLQSII